MKNEDYTLFPIPTKLLDLMGIDTTAALRVAVDADGKLTVIKGAQQTELEDITIDDLPEENTDECETGCAHCEYWCPHCKRCLLEEDDAKGDWDGK